MLYHQIVSSIKFISKWQIRGPLTRQRRFIELETTKAFYLFTLNHCMPTRRDGGERVVMQNVKPWDVVFEYKKQVGKSTGG